MNPTGTFLFTDMVGSTRHWETIPEMRAVVDAHFELLATVVASAGGEIFSTMGDGVAAFFPSSQAAVDAAIAVQLAHPAGGVRVRIGLHTGEAVRTGEDFRGRPLNRAARVMALGHPGQILLSDVTASVLRTAPDPPMLRDLGFHRLRDLEEVEHLWQVDHPGLASSFPALHGADARASLPSQRSSFVGRERERSAVLELLAQQRIITLTGVGGVGKTRLAVQLATEVSDQFTRVWFVDLASVNDPDDVDDTIARSIGAAIADDAIRASAALVGSRRTLIILDNCEHVIDRAAEAVDHLVSQCAALVVLATSREALGIDGEFVVPLRSLDPATSASQLFVDRACAAGMVAELLEASMVREICERLDGIPLAVELAAARASALGLQAVVDALDDLFSLLSTGRRRAVDRHATMRATIDWSYRLLDVSEQRLFCRMAMFPNGFELDAVAHVGASIGLSGADAVDAVGSLVQKSLVTIPSGSFHARHRMLETMRAFALEQLDRSEDRVAAQLGHAEWIASLTDHADEDASGQCVQIKALRLERETEGWRDAMTFAARARSSSLALRLTGPPTAYFLLARSDLAELVRPLLSVGDAAGSNRRWVLACLVVSAGFGAQNAEVEEWIEEIERIDRDDPSAVGAMMRWFSAVCQGRIPDAIRTCLSAMDDPQLPTTAHDLFGSIAALEHFSLSNEVGDPHGLLERALSIIEHSAVPLHRVTALLGAAWALAPREPRRALSFVRCAMDELPGVPALPRITLPGSASRLLATLDPAVAARGLLDQLDESTGGAFVDLIPLFYAGALLRRIGHPGAHALDLAWGSLGESEPTSMIDFAELARVARLCVAAETLDQIEGTIRRALEDLVVAGPIEMAAVSV